MVMIGLLNNESISDYVFLLRQVPLLAMMMTVVTVMAMAIWRSIVSLARYTTGERKHSRRQENGSTGSEPS